MFYLVRDFTSNVPRTLVNDTKEGNGKCIILGQRFQQKFLEMIQMGRSSHDFQKFKWDERTNWFWRAHAWNWFGGWPYSGYCLLRAKIQMHIITLIEWLKWSSDRQYGSNGALKETDLNWHCDKSILFCCQFFRARTFLTFVKLCSMYWGPAVLINKRMNKMIYMTWKEW